MEILQLLLSFLLKEFGGEKLTPILSGLQNGNFNLQNILSSITPEMLSSVFKLFSGEQNNKPCPDIF